ncbi:MAG TPA: heparan-alpha-glucosaminide N-acetyltransferase domain-containing protein [Longimicrobiales bacterium]|nr:heparan-alpha-glucosaminide N-acetyltransferase domain-containing protein [Longimicrobiales bacterium]
MNPTTVVATEPVSGAPDVVTQTTRSTSTRLLSLDAFRGITIAGMLLVNNPGSWSHIYPPLEHATWNGWTPTDLIFPFFVFIVGVAMTFSFGKQIENGAERNDLLLKTAKRALLIFLTGLAIHSFPWVGYDYSHWRIPGVLQRIAVAYLFAASIYLFTTVRGQVIAIATLLVGYWLLQTLVPVPGGFTGVLKPGLDLGAYIDRSIFTENHLWREAKTWDPEGLLSTLPAIGTALLGGLAGQWIRSRQTQIEKVTGLFIAGAVLMCVGGMWGWVFPINKSLWTSSYVLFTAGFAAQFLAFCYWLIDVKGYQRWAKPFIIYGMNAIAAFFLSAVVARTMNLIKVGGDHVALKTFIYKNFYESWLAPINASLLFAISYVLLFLGILTIMYRRKIFIKL